MPPERRWHVRLAVVDALLGAFPPFTLSRIRRLALQACGINMGRATFFWGLPKLTGPGSFTSRLKVGAETGFNDGCVFDLAAPITVGNHVSVGHEVHFLTTQRQEGGPAAPITIGDGVWLGARCRILGGVTVGAGSVVGAGVTVTTDVPANTLLSGAKPVSLAKWR
jgi:acetyltransferase-like isoleucine patch superfamily enzyme